MSSKTGGADGCADPTRPRAWRSAGVLLAVPLLLFCSTCNSRTAATVVAADVRFERAPCSFNVPQNAKVDCGWLTAPEKTPGERHIRLHVAIYRSRSNHAAPDPIVWIVGGPGGRAHAISAGLFERVVEPYIGKRDFIVMDVRGTGYAQPALDCGPAGADYSAWLVKCRDRLSAVADLSAYHSAAASVDLEHLRLALGYKAWNLFGESYGTRVALTAMRDWPAGIRSVVLDSVVPPEVDQYADGPTKFEHALETVFQNCASDSRCNAAWPNLRTVLLEAQAKLDREPKQIAGTWFESPYHVRFDGSAMMGALHMALYESDLVRRLPKALYAARDGINDPAWESAVRISTVIARRLVDVGAHLAVHCAEEIPFADVARLRREDASLPWLRRAGTGLNVIGACEVWNVPARTAVETKPVESDIPVLVLSGEYDPVTPPSYAASAARHLKRSHVFNLKGTGHWATADPTKPCVRQLVLDFLDEPGTRPANACASSGTNWVLE